MTTITSQWLTGNFGPVTEEVTAVDLAVTGTIPDGLDGRYLRNGPNPRGEVDPASYHWFTGDGMVHGVRLRDGRAEWYRNRWVSTDERFGANTNVIGQAGRTWAIVESGPPPIELTDELDPIGPTAFDGAVREGYTAHPKLDPATGELHAVSYLWAWDHLRYTVIDVDGRVRREVRVPIGGGPMVHDCAITENQVVLFDLPVTFDLDAAMAGTRFPYAWNPDHGARVGLLPREGEAEDVRWYEVGLCYVFHPLNAYEDEAGRVVLDLVRHPKMFDQERLGPADGATRLDRWTIDPAAGRVAESTVDDSYVELPRTDPRCVGRPHRYGYAMEFSGADHHGGGVKYDVATGLSEHRQYGEGRVTDEMIFVPRAPDAGEDEGWLLSFVYDATTDTSDLVIVAADDFTGDPVATIHLPQRVPFGFHGNWVPSEG
jgi:carotenoid cleavage dioxygenase